MLKDRLKMNNNIELENQDNQINTQEVASIETLKEQTKVSILDAFYKDEWVFGKVFSIITWKKINPSDLVNDLWNIRGEFKKLDASNDEEFEKAA